MGTNNVIYVDFQTKKVIPQEPSEYINDAINYITKPKLDDEALAKTKRFMGILTALEQEEID